MKDNLEIYEIGFRKRNFDNQYICYSVYEANKLSYTDQFGYTEMPRGNGEWYAKIKICDFSSLIIDLPFKHADYLIKSLPESFEESGINPIIYEIGYRKNGNFYSIYEKNKKINYYNEVFEKEKDWYAKIDVFGYQPIIVDMSCKEVEYIACCFIGRNKRI